VNFDGSGDYLDAGAVDTAFGSSSDWTLELFIYPRTVGLSAITDPRTGDSTNHPLIWIKSTGVLYYYAGGADRIVGTTVLATNKWHHVAAVRSGGTTTLYLDGKSEGSFSDSLDYASTTNFRIGQRFTSTAYNYNGFISNLRLVNGTAVYTGPRITPPTAPLTNVTNTKLLCCQSNAHAGAAVTSPNMGGVNDGTVWSSGAGANFEAARPATVGFDGDISTFTRTDNASVTATVTLPKSVAFTTLKVRGARDSGNGTITVNGVDVSSQFTSSSSTLETVTITGVTSPLTSIALTGVSGAAQPRFSAIYVDDVILVDPLTPNGDAAATNFNPFNTDINTVRGQESGYATMNPLDNESFTLADGNLNVTNMGSARQVHADIFVDSGKWYAEFTCKAAMNDTLFGVANNNGTSFLGSDTNSWGVISINGNRIHDQNGSGGQSSYGSSFTTGDVISVALNMDSGKWYAAKNGVYFDGGNPVTGANPAHSGLTGFLTFAVGSNDTGGDVSCNFGQKPFKFPPPDGFQPLNTANTRPVKVISRPKDYVGVATYDGSGSTFQEMNVGFKADFVWCKSVTNAENHALFDSVRGSTKFLRSDSTDDEYTISNVNFTLKGFSFANGSGEINESGQSYVGLAWKAGGDKNTFNVDDVGYASASAAGLDGGSTNPTGASVNTESKFGIYTFDGNSSNRTLSHGLGQQPDFTIVKKKSADGNSWVVWHKSIANDKYLILNGNNTQDTDATLFNSHASDSSTLWTLGSNTSINETGQSSVAYLWCDVPGMQKFGSYTANNSSDGVFVELGFKPKILLIKNYDSTGDWIIWDGERNKFNPVNRQIWPYTASGTYGAYDQVGSNYPLDFLSNGFKMRTTDADMNGSSRNYIYAAWAEAPSIDLYGGGANAR